MKQVLQNLKSGKTEVADVPVPLVRKGCVLVRTAASLVSAGTERNLVSFAEKNLVGKAQSRPDLVKQVIDKAKREGLLTTFESAMNRLDQPLVLGYSSAGTVIEAASDVKDFKPGDRVVCAGGGHAVHAEYALVPRNLIAHLPDEVDFESGAFATMGAIALNGIRLSNPQVGEKVAVIGLGLLGLITAQLVQAAGCDVVGMDISSARVKFARKLDITADSNQNIQKKYPSLTRGRGFDKVLICADTPSDETVELAGIIARDRAHVISLGVVGLNLQRKLYFEKELFFQVSRSAGPGRYDATYEELGVDYPAGYVRWTEGRNLEAFVDLLAAGKIDMSRLVTHRFPIQEAPKAYELITGKVDEPYLGVLLTYTQKKTKRREKIVLQPVSAQISAEEELSLGVFGAGNYANAVFLPAVKKAGGVKLAGITTSGGLSAQHSARKFGFSFAASSSKEILSNKDINLVAILTRHKSHAGLTLEALKKGKHVYCEKPLAIQKSELDEIAKVLAKKKHAYLSVGFNRRFAPMAVALKDYFADCSEPFYVNYRVNAGFIPADHWLHDPEQGGGRLVGEGCHFIDFLCYMIGRMPLQVSAKALPDAGKYNRDNFLITIEFEDGSIGTVAYLSNGNKRFPKEYVEVFNGGKIGILKDYRSLELVDENNTAKQHSRFRQDKGHQVAWQAFVEAVRNGTQEPIPYEQLLTSSYTTLACQQALVSTEPVRLQDFINAD
jgi:predicted dehydrogenase/threonine dehydrogenase-like Zn-dependent dehydrogenase